METIARSIIVALLAAAAARATTILISECHGPSAPTDFFCTGYGDAPVAGSVASFSNGYAQNPNSYSILAFNYTDPGGNVTLTGNAMTVHIEGNHTNFIYAAGAATANALAAGALGVVVDIFVGANFPTFGGITNYSQSLSGTCDATAASGPSTIEATAAHGLYDTFLPTLGSVGDCAGGSPSGSSGPTANELGAQNGLYAIGTIYFTGSSPQTITSNWSAYVPDPALGGTIPSPSNIGTISAGLPTPLRQVTSPEKEDDLTPEPATFGLAGIAVGLGLAWKKLIRG